MIIKEFKLFNKKIFVISHDGLYDNYILFNKIKVLRIENDRNFWNDWE